MSAPLFLVDTLPDGERATLAGPEGHHAATVQRLRVGEEVLLGDGRGGTATAVVTDAGRSTLDLQVTGRRYEQPPAPRLVVVQAIGKGDRSELAVQAMTEVGVDEIVPWPAARSVVRWRGERGEKAWRRWVVTAREAAKQSRRARLPVVSEPAPTRAVAARLGGATAALVLDADADTRLSALELPSGDSGGAGGQGGQGGPGDPDGSGPEIVLVIGPEGGVSPAELSAFETAGARQVRLGATVLRTSTAGVAALAVLSTRLGRW